MLVKNELGVIGSLLTMKSMMDRRQTLKQDFGERISRDGEVIISFIKSSIGKSQIIDGIESE